MKKTTAAILLAAILFSLLSFSSFAEGSYINGTATKPTISDAIKVFSYISGKCGLSEQEKLRANANRDYQISLIDAMRYFLVVAGKEKSLKRPKDSKKDYFYKKYPAMASTFGCEGSLYSPIIFADGSFAVAHESKAKTRYINFGVADIKGKIKWYNAEGWLPCFISEYSSEYFQIKIQTFANEITVKGERYEAAFSRISVTNTTDSEKMLPLQSAELFPINNSAETCTSVQAGQTVVRDYAMFTDNFKKDTVLPAKTMLSDAGSFDENYLQMKRYWEERISGLVQISKLPDERLINAYKAGYVYTMIVKDENSLNVGENGYDDLWDHDAIGIITSLFTAGDFEYAKEYISSIPVGVEYAGRSYEDAVWKYSYPYALYLMKTGDESFVNENFEDIYYSAHRIEEDIDKSIGIIHKTNAIDWTGYWTVDDFSALFGLTAYTYICNRLGKAEEAEWAKNLYDKLLCSLNETMDKLQSDTGISYISASPFYTNEQTMANNNANQASMFLFGRWTWDGYLFGAAQQGTVFEQTDQTYAAMFEALYGDTERQANFGGYPGYSSAYNAGYGLAALRGEQYRDMGIKAYQFMISSTQSGPFSWWEGIPTNSQSELVEGIPITSGTGSCPHMWGQSFATKVLIDSLIAEKSDETVIIGRGIPSEWTDDEIEVLNYTISGNRKMGFNLSKNGNTLTLTLSGDAPVGGVSLELIALKGAIASASCTFDNEAGTVFVPPGTTTATIILK